MNFKNQKQQLEEIRKESFKQGKWKGREEILKEVEKLIDGLFKFRGRYYDCKELKSKLKELR